MVKFYADPVPDLDLGSLLHFTEHYEIQLFAIFSSTCLTLIGGFFAAVARRFVTPSLLHS